MMKKKILSVVLVLALGLSGVLGTVSLSDFIALQVLADDDGNTESDVSGGDAEEINPGVAISKYVTTEYKTDDDGNINTDSYEYTLNLDVFTTGVVYQSATKTVPADIVLVLDQSTSMMWPASQAEDNGLDDGNIGIVDGTYTYTYADTNSDGTKDLTWTQAESIEVTPLYGIWSATTDDQVEYVTELDLTYTSNAQNSGYTVTIGGKTYTYGETYIFSKADYLNYWTGDYAEEYIAVFGYLYSESRQSDLIEAVVEFIANLDTKAGHRVSIVTYNGWPDNDGGGDLDNNGATTVYALTDEANTSTTGEYDYTPIVNTVLGWVNAEASGNTDGVAESTVANPASTTISTTTTEVKTFNLEHYTQICFGVEDAEDILSDAKWTNSTTLTDEYDGTGRTQLAVVFTDGIPTTLNAYSEYSTDSTSTTNVNKALQAAYNMKNDDVTVFTIAMLDDVYLSDDTGSSRTNYHDSTTTSGRTTTYNLRYGSTFISLFLDLLSSNYNGASSFPTSTFPSSSNLYNDDTNYSITADYAKTVISSTDADGETTSDYAHYYYPIDTSSDAGTDVAQSLASVFETVAGMMEGTATYNLDGNTQVRDVMTAEYYIPLDNGESTYDISLYIAYCEGENSEGNDNYSESLYDSGRYTWSENALIYNTLTGTKAAGFGDVSVTVETVYIDITDGNGDYVYYANNVKDSESDSGIYYLVDGSGNYINHSGESVNTPITLYASQQVIVEGFDFNDYYVTTTDKTGGEYAIGDYGAKLVIEFEIEPDTVGVGSGDTATGATTIGGNSVETNTTASGIYIYSGETSYTQIEYFPVPDADIPIVVDLSVEDQTIYLGNAISVVDLVEIDGHTIQGVANANVDITYKLYAAEEISEEEYNKLSDGKKAQIVIKEIEQSGTTVTQYYQYKTDDDGNKIVEYSATIDAGESAVDATTGIYTLDTLITPEVDTDYIVDVTVTPTEEGSVVETSAISTVFRVYVLHPAVDVNDIWVDYATPVDLRQDNVISVVDSKDADAYNTLSMENISWESINSYDYAIPDPNNETPPTVTYGYTARRGIEYTAAEFFEYGVREDKEFYISSMTIDSSDGYNNTTHYTYTEDEESTTFDININRYDLEISKTVDADTYDTYPQSFIFDLSYTDTEIITQQKYYAEDVNGFTIFETANSVVDLYVDTTGYGTETAFEIYVNTNDGNGEMTVIDGMVYYNVTAVFFDADNAAYTSGSYYINQTNFAIIYDGKTYTAKELWADEEETIPVYETVGTNDYEKTMEVIVDPDMSNVETVEWEDSSGTRYYTFNVLVTDLYCGVELDITEDTSWSWRYDPGFTTTTTTQYADYVNNDSDSSNNVSNLEYVTQSAYEFDITDGYVSIRVYNTTIDDETVKYVIANVVTKQTDGDVEVRTVTYGNVTADIDSYFIDFDSINFESIDNFITLMEGKGVYPVFDTTSVMSVDGNGNITQTTTTETTAYKIIDYDEEIAARVAYGDDNGTMGSLGDGLLGTYQNEDSSEDNYLDYEYAYYLTDYTFESVAEVTTSKDGSSATVLVTNSGDYLDKSSGDAYADWTRKTEEQNTYLDADGNFDLDSEATEIMYATVSATYFNINEVDIDVYNSLIYEYWLSYSELAQNTYNELGDPR